MRFSDGVCTQCLSGLCHAKTQLAEENQYDQYMSLLNMLQALAATRAGCNPRASLAFRARSRFPGT